MLFALSLVLFSSCKDSEDEFVGDYKYYLTIESQVRLHLADNAEDEKGMAVNPVIDRLSRTIYFMKEAVNDLESMPGETKKKEAALLTVCDSLYRNYADVNPENKGNVVCYVKLFRARLQNDGTINDPVMLKYYQFWMENYNKSDDTSSNLDKPDSLKAIDLGLSVLWANCNIGAKQPRDYGMYLAWGDATGKLWSGSGIGWKNDAYTWNTDNYGGINPPDDISGTALDVVTLNWGDGWRIPSYNDALELCENCQWKLRTDGDIKWYEVIGPNGNSIIMPLAGVYGDDLSNAGGRFQAGPYSVNVTGFYWTSTSCKIPSSTGERGYGINDGVVTAWCFKFNSKNGDELVPQEMLLDYLRAFHMSIRPVHDK